MDNRWTSREISGVIEIGLVIDNANMWLKLINQLIYCLCKYVLKVNWLIN